MTRMKKSDLLALLKMTKREAVVGGKKLSQVSSAVLQGQGFYLSTTSIVRDGVSSIGLFTVPTTDDESFLGDITVANIDLLIGALSAHGSDIDISYADGKITLKSGSKRTTLASDGRAKAFPHTNKTVGEWSADSEARFTKSLCNIELNHYTMQDGTSIDGVVATVRTKDLLDAMRSGSINGQMIEATRLNLNPDCTLEVVAGDEMKGATRTVLDSGSPEGTTLTTSIGGGFENILAHTASENCDLVFFDFSAYGAGVAVVLRTNEAVVFQREANNG